MKNILWISLLLAGALSLSGCTFTVTTNSKSGKNTTNERNNMSNAEIRKEIEQYVTVQLQPLGSEEKRLIKRYQEIVTSKTITKKAFYDTLTKDIIPDYTAFSKKVEALHPTLPALQKAHQKYLSGVLGHLNGFKLIKESIETNNQSKVTEANASIDKGVQDFHSYHRDVEKLGEQYGVTVTFNQNPN
ncbi:lipoprotein [Fictibacillus macauensis ZFHKF-1]|uniref:Lipoprotein n=1 Tax=Fictibacillus macauensis ZFHKF-1 TaxID=1196324 RepID=I8UC51_9BACL|nr:hypothetical protein [Fictibacillus macauensis]EIT84475.1 lipoprotein [Fictibacillus macauensis ZFHKF-1]